MLTCEYGRWASHLLRFSECVMFNILEHVRRVRKHTFVVVAIVALLSYVQHHAPNTELESYMCALAVVYYHYIESIPQKIVSYLKSL